MLYQSHWMFYIVAQALFEILTVGSAQQTLAPTAHFLCLLHMETISCAIWTWLWWKMFDVYQDVCCDVISRA